MELCARPHRWSGQRVWRRAATTAKGSARARSHSASCAATHRRHERAAFARALPRQRYTRSRLVPVYEPSRASAGPIDCKAALVRTSTQSHAQPLIVVVRALPRQRYTRSRFISIYEPSRVSD